MATSRITTKRVYVPESVSISETVKAMEKNRGTISRPRPELRFKDQDALKQSINAPAPPSAATNLQQGQNFDNSVSTLPIDKIKLYDRNPRTSPNPKYHEIKAAIRAQGKYKGTLTVTKRPGDPDYMLYMGGNTRLQIVKELYAETGSPAYGQVHVIYHAWISEADTLASHIIENDARGDTLFIEKARGIFDLMREIERETGRKVNAREIQVVTSQMGMTVNKTTALLYEFAIENLVPMGLWLTRENVSIIKRRYGQYESLANARTQSGNFRTRFPPRSQAYQAEFAQSLASRQLALRDSGDQTTVVALRGEVLNEFLTGLERILADVLGLDEKIAQRVMNAFEAAGKESLPAETLDALIRGDTTEVGHSPQSEAAAQTQSAQAPQEEREEREPTTTTKPAVAPTGAKQQPTVATPAVAANPQTSETALPSPQETDAAVPQHSASTVAASSPASAPARVESNQVDVDALAPAPLAPGEVLTPERVSAFGRYFMGKLNDFCVLTRIQQWLEVRSDLDIPYLFWLEMPEEIAQIEIEQRLEVSFCLESIADPEFGVLDQHALRVRSSAYRLVALLSGQLGGVIVLDDGRWTNESTFGERLPPESAWGAAVQGDRMSLESFTFCWENCFDGVVAPRNAQLGVQQHDFLLMLHEPRLTQPWLALMQAYVLWGQVLTHWRTMPAPPAGTEND